jgi:hypothetical protein
LPCLPDEERLTRVVFPVARSWTKTSWYPFVSPFTAFVASPQYVTNRPLTEIAE